VRARIDGADWPEDSTVWEFEVPPVFYQTSWFLFACLGTLGIAGFSVKEGREAFGKARGLACCCAGKCGDAT
jgi:hypothetical protein